METWPGVALVKDFKFKPFHNNFSRGFKVFQKGFQRIFKGLQKPCKSVFVDKRCFPMDCQFFLSHFSIVS